VSKEGKEKAWEAKDAGGKALESEEGQQLQLRQL
jgi:hypothetical protein